MFQRSLNRISRYFNKFPDNMFDKVQHIYIVLKFIVNGEGIRLKHLWEI